MNTSKHHLNEAAGAGSPRLILGCVLGSVLLHLLLLIVLPSWRVEQTAPAAVLDVQLLASVAEMAAPPQPAAPERTPQQKPVAVPTVRAPSTTPAVIAVEAAVPVAEAPRFVAAPASVPVIATAPATVAAPAASTSRNETVTPPSFSAAYLRNPPPEYPRLAKHRGEEGTVTLKVLVTAEGAPARIEVERSSGFKSLDAAAAEAVRGWRFQPARRGSQNIEDWALVPLRFRLDS